MRPPGVITGVWIIVPLGVEREKALGRCMRQFCHGRGVDGGVVLSVCGSDDLSATCRSLVGGGPYRRCVPWKDRGRLKRAGAYFWEFEMTAECLYMVKEGRANR